MEQAKHLKEFLQESQASTIDSIAKYIEDHIDENWKTILHLNWDQLQEAYNKVGDMAYGTYLNFLFLSVNKQLKEVGLCPKPRLPGNLDISREWGANEEGTDQQRWMWSTVHSMNGESLGTIVTIVFHDHTQYRIPRKPQIIALSETRKEDIVEALSLRSEDFRSAREFAMEYKEYLQNQQNKG